jgi:hypothetical protein
MREIDKKLIKAHKKLSIKPGDIFESCSYHPVLCIGVDYKNDNIWGVSLINGQYPMSCSLLHCGVKKLTPKQAWLIKVTGPVDVEVRESFSPDNRWWSKSGDALKLKAGLVKPKVVKVKNG